MDIMIVKTITLLIVIVCYTLALSRKVKLMYASLGSAALLLILKIINPVDAFDSINLDVLGIYWGFMMVSMIFMRSQVPELISNRLVDHLKHEKYIILGLCILTAFLSAFMENVGVVLMMAPVAIHVSRKMKSSLFIYLIPIAVSSNIVTTLSMIADPPALLVAMAAKMTFFDFYWFQGRLGLGTVSFLGVAAAMLSILFIFRKYNKKEVLEKEYIKADYIPLVIFFFSILFLAFGSSYLSPGMTGLIAGVVSVGYGFFHQKKGKEMFTEFDWSSFFFVVGIFVVIKSLEVTGLLTDFGNLIASTGIQSPIIMLFLITFISVIASSIIDNVPYTVLMIPVCFQIATALNMSAYPLLFGMLIGTGMGGNITPVGATANVFACGILEKHGHKVKLKEYLKISVPFTLAAVIVAYIILQLVWL
jgi:Na+/H+ antiporter NhaD/arsenite permease-like protein